LAVDESSEDFEDLMEVDGLFEDAEDAEAEGLSHDAVDLALRGRAVEDNDGWGIWQPAEELDGTDGVVDGSAGLLLASPGAGEVDDGGVDVDGFGEAIGFFNGGGDVAHNSLGFQQLGELRGPVLGGVGTVTCDEHVESGFGLES